MILTTVVMLIPACNRPKAERVSPSVSGQSSASLEHRPLIFLGFMGSTHRALTTKAHQPLLDYLTSRTPYRYRALFNSDSEKAIGGLEERLVEISELGVISYLEAHRQFGAVPLVRRLNRDGEPASYSVFVTRRDAGVDTLADLEGRSLALGSFHSTLGHFIPRCELVQAGVDLEAIGAIEHLSGGEAVVSAVLEGRFDAGAVEDIVADRYSDKGLRKFHVSRAVPSAPLVVRDDLPASVVETIRDALLDLDFEGAAERGDWHEEIRYGFHPVTHEDYQPILKLMRSRPTRCADACHGGPEVRFGAPSP